MLKTLRQGGGKIAARMLPRLAGLCLLLTVANACDKAQSGQTAQQQPAKPTAAKANDWGDQSAMAAMTAKFTPEEKALREKQMAQLEAFAAAKEKQAERLASAAGEDISPEARRFFGAAKQGNADAVQTIFTGYAKRYHKYGGGNSGDKPPDDSYWATMMEVDLGYECVIPVDPKTVQSFVDDTINSIPAGSVYFGGTDPGRGLITAFSKSHADADPFFTLTQNALADNRYLAYLRQMYGNKIYIPSAEDSQKCFTDYYQDAQKRMEHDSEHPDEPRQVKPGEDIKMSKGRLEISGQVAVMAINGLLAKVIFDHNPKQEFYVEESFPLEWMYPYLEPRGPIMKLDRAEFDEMPAETVKQDRDYWQKIVKAKLGGWLAHDTTVASIAKFAEKVYGNRDLSGFSGDERYLQSDFAQKLTSKLRSSIAGLYDWRSQHAKSSVERERMAREADFAYRQAFALCPYSPEAVFRYVNLLSRLGRLDDAILVTEAALKVSPNEKTGISNLLQQLKQQRGK